MKRISTKYIVQHEGFDSASKLTYEFKLPLFFEDDKFWLEEGNVIKANGFSRDSQESVDLVRYSYDNLTELYEYLKKDMVNYMKDRVEEPWENIEEFEVDRDKFSITIKDVFEYGYKRLKTESLIWFDWQTKEFILSYDEKLNEVVERLPELDKTLKDKDIDKLFAIYQDNIGLWIRRGKNEQLN